MGMEHRFVEPAGSIGSLFYNASNVPCSLVLLVYNQTHSQDRATVCIGGGLKRGFQGSITYFCMIRR